MRLERLLSIALFLSNRRRVLAREVAAHFGVSLRTVYRDVQALMTAGFPVVGSAGDGYRLEQSAYLRPLALTDEEAELLVLSATAFGASVKPDVREALDRAALKLEGVLEGPARSRTARLRKQLLVATSARTDVGPRPEVLAALRDRVAAKITYVDPKTLASSTRTIEPVGLVSTGAWWWLIAYCRLRKDARAFRTDAIASWKSKAPFAPREGFSLAEITARDGQRSAEIFAADKPLSRRRAS